MLDAAPRPRYGAYAPIYTNAGVAAFARDHESPACRCGARETGYPGDPNYREFYRDIGFDLDFDYVGPYVQPTGERKNTGIKYYRITGQGAALSEGAATTRGRAKERAAVHAGNFVYNRERQIEHLAQALGRPPIVVSPYDAELYGHWWFEGPDFIEAYIRKATFDQQTYKLVEPHATTSPRCPEQQVAHAADVLVGRGRLRGRVARSVERLDLPAPAQVPRSGWSRSPATSRTRTACSAAR